MDPHSTWFDFLPGYGALREGLHDSLVRTWTWQVFQTTNFQIVHVLCALVVLVFLTFGAFRYAGAVSGSGDAGLVPPPKLGMRNLFEVLADTVLGLIPGFLPPTDTLKTNLALSISVFLISHAVGVREHGLKYFKHFLGPIWWLAWLMLPIEIVSHIARPVSLAMRLMGNIVGDHKLVLVFFGILPILLPLPFMVMGVLVCVVQAVVFSLLTTVYISQAVAHEEH